MRMFRLWLGRALIHAGLAVLPRGRIKTELHERLTAWSLNVYATIAAKG